MKRRAARNERYSDSEDTASDADSIVHSEASGYSESLFDESDYGSDYDYDTEDLFEEILIEPSFSDVNNLESNRNRANMAFAPKTRQQSSSAPQRQQSNSSGTNHREKKKRMHPEVIVIPDSENESEAAPPASNTTLRPSNRSTAVVVDLTACEDTREADRPSRRPNQFPLSSSHFHPAFQATALAVAAAREAARNDNRTLGSLASSSSSRNSSIGPSNLYYRNLYTEAFLATPPPPYYHMSHSNREIADSSSFSALDPFELFGNPSFGSRQGSSETSRRFPPNLGRNYGRWEERQPTYEELLSISERIGMRLVDCVGVVKPKGATKKAITKLPVTIFASVKQQLMHAAQKSSETDSSKDSRDINASIRASSPLLLEECVICLTEFEKTDKIKTLPCCHYFHVKCVDSWLIVNGSCPSCRIKI